MSSEIRSGVHSAVNLDAYVCMLKQTYTHHSLIETEKKQGDRARRTEIPFSPHNNRRASFFTARGNDCQEPRAGRQTCVQLRRSSVVSAATSRRLRKGPQQKGPVIRRVNRVGASHSSQQQRATIPEGSGGPLLSNLPALRPHKHPIETSTTSSRRTHKTRTSLPFFTVQPDCVSVHTTLQSTPSIDGIEVAVDSLRENFVLHRVTRLPRLFRRRLTAELLLCQRSGD